MTSFSVDFVGRPQQKILIAKTLGEAFATVAERLFGKNRKALIDEWQIDRKTVENIRIGKAGAAVITKALLARKESHDDAWDMADAIIEQVLGESRSEYEERKLREHIEKTNNAISLHQERRARRTALAESADAVDAGLARLAASLDREVSR